MSRKYRVDQVLADLDAADKAAYEAMLRQPATTIDDLLAWLDDHGFKVSRGAAWKHRRNFEEQTASLRRSAEMARAFVDVAKAESVESISDAAIFRLSQVMMEQSMRLDTEGELDPKDLVNMTKAIRNLIGGKREVEELRTQQRDAIAQAEQLARTGATSSDVVATIKQALGITPAPGSGSGGAAA